MYPKLKEKRNLIDKDYLHDEKGEYLYHKSGQLTNKNCQSQTSFLDLNQVVSFFKNKIVETKLDALNIKSQIDSTIQRESLVEHFRKHDPETKQICLPKIHTNIIFLKNKNRKDITMRKSKNRQEKSLKSKKACLN